MAQIAPSSTIQLFKGMMLKPDEEDTAWFATESARDEYFTQRIYRQYTNTSYQRVNNNTIKLEGNIGNLYDCNYMRFKNVNFLNKWFYAFILSVNYINNETVEIVYEIDEIQTWLKDFAFEYCFIERQHARFDGYFSNLVPEDLDLGSDYVCNAKENMDLNKDDDPTDPNRPYGLYAGFLATRTPSGGTPPYNQVIQGVYCPLFAYGNAAAYTAAQLSQYNSELLPSLSPDDVLAVYMYPSKFGDFGTIAHPVPEVTFIPWHLERINLTTLDGHTVRNKKLFSYPYNFLKVYNGNGRYAIYKWEQWTVGRTWGSDTALIEMLGDFSIRGTVMPPVAATCYPLEYGGMAVDLESGLTIDNFPQCAWAGDTFKAWWAQNKGNVVMGLVATAITGSMGVGMASLSPVYPAAQVSQALGRPQPNAGAVLQDYAQQRHDFGVLQARSNYFTSGLTAIGNVMAKMYDTSVAPPHVTGHITTDTLNAGLALYRFYAEHMCVRKEVAERLDDFFDMYGYAQHKIGIPDPTARQNWSYIKTIGCQITGNIPADSSEAICKKFDSGIRFWKNPDRIGDYSMSNSPAGPES